MTPGLARRRSLLTAALGFALLREQDGSAPPETAALRKWLDNWRGVGDVVTRMNRQGYMLHLSNVDASTWRASFSSSPNAQLGRLRDRADAVAGRAGRGVGGGETQKPRLTTFRRPQ